MSSGPKNNNLCFGESLVWYYKLDCKQCPANRRWSLAADVEACYLHRLKLYFRYQKLGLGKCRTHTFDVGQSACPTLGATITGSRSRPTTRPAAVLTCGASCQCNAKVIKPRTRRTHEADPTAASAFSLGFTRFDPPAPGEWEAFPWLSVQHVHEFCVSMVLRGDGSPQGCIMSVVCVSRVGVRSEDVTHQPLLKSWSDHTRLQLRDWLEVWGRTSALNHTSHYLWVQVLKISENRCVCVSVCVCVCGLNKWKDKPKH